MNRSENFYELFRAVEDGINGNEVFDLHTYRKQAEYIASKKSDGMTNLAIIVFMLGVIVASLQYVSGMQKDNKIKQLERYVAFLKEPTVDTLRFDCRRCGHPHNLAAIDTLK